MNIFLEITGKSNKIKRPAGAYHLSDRPNRNGSYEDHVMANRQLPSPEVLRQLLRYDPDTGKLFWKERGPEWFVDPRARILWNARYSGKEAFFTIDRHGYRHGKIFNRDHLAHRLIWAMVVGVWPIDEIDHVNGDCTDNRIDNLREAARFENQHNKGVNATNTSGFKGASWSRRDRKWLARITVKSRRISLGRFDTAEQAHAAYCAAAKRLHGEFARTA